MTEYLRVVRCEGTVTHFDDVAREYTAKLSLLPLNNDDEDNDDNDEFSQSTTRQLSEPFFDSSVVVRVEITPLAVALAFDAFCFAVAVASAFLILWAAAARTEDEDEDDDDDDDDDESSSSSSSSSLARWQWHAAFCWSRVLYGLSALPFAVLTLPAQALLGVCFPCDAAPTGYDRRGRCVLCKAAA